MGILSEPHFHDEAAAVAKLESIVWPDGPVCPHCGNAGKIYELKGVRTKPSKKHPKGIERHGLKTCGACRKQFTVRVGTLFEDSPIPMFKWWQAVHLLASSKKGISSHQLHRTLQVTYKTAWFMAHRIREAMRDGAFSPMGGSGGTVEADETFIGFKKNEKLRRGVAHKHAILTLVERGGGARSFHIERASIDDIVPIARANISAEAHVMTDTASYYRPFQVGFASHQSVNHKDGEYGRGDVHTNTIEGFFSIFKRGMRGVYQHCSEKHLHRYLAEFDFRYNNRVKLGIDDEARAYKAARGIVGKRLKYRDSLDPDRVL